MSFLAFFERLADSPWSVGLHESEIAYSLIESFHVWSLCLFFGMTLMFDLRLLGWTMRTVPVSEVIRRLQPWRQVSYGDVRGHYKRHLDGGGLARAVASVIWTYDGWIAVSMIAGEVVAPERLMKRIIIIGMLVIVTLYIGANLAYLYMMPVSIMAQQKEAIARTVMTEIAGPTAGVVILLAIMTSVFGALNGNLLAKPRVAYAMARDGLTFSFLGKIHPRWSTPWAALLIQGLVAIIMVLVLRDFDTLTTYFVVVEWAALIFAVGAVFVLRRKMAEAPRPFSTPGYPWVPLLFVVGTIVGVSAIVWGEFQVGNFSPIYGLGIALAGFPVHQLWKRLKRSS